MVLTTAGRTAASTAPPRRPGAPSLRLWTLPEARWAALSAALFAAGGLAQLLGAPAPAWWTLYLACYAAGGWQPARDGLQALREPALDVDLLMVLAAVAAASVGLVFDGALLIVIFAASGAMEAFATARTASSVRALLDLSPQTAARATATGEQMVQVTELVVGDQVVVRPGERIGADGTVVDGASDVDQASITGEPLPVARRAGDQVFAGTLNGTGLLRVRVTRPAHDSVVARIVALVEQASSTAAPTQLFIERVERRYSVAMVAATVALLLVPLALGAAFEPTLLRAITFMIVASPCALVLSTMPPLLAAMANAGRHGVLIKSAVVMEQLGQSTQVAFDKTGTLTTGRPSLVAHWAVPDLPGGPDRLLALAAAAELASEHPLGRAVVRAARAAGLPELPATDFDSAPGRGVRARVDGQPVQVAGPTSLSADAGPFTRTIQAYERDGLTAVVVTLAGRPVGALGLTDAPRAEAAAAVRAARLLTGRRPVLLTGDNARAAAALAGQVGITDVRAGLLPEGKVEAVRELQAQGHRVLLVGDGVNDAPALATADVGLAMGGIGSDVSLETADAVVVRDELGAVPAAIALSRRAGRLVRFNLAFAAVVIAGLVTWDLAGHLPLPLAVAGHEGSTVLVALNGLRLLGDRAWRRAAVGP